MRRTRARNRNEQPEKLGFGGPGIYILSCNKKHTTHERALVQAAPSPDRPNMRILKPQGLIQIARAYTYIYIYIYVYVYMYIYIYIYIYIYLLQSYALKCPETSERYQVSDESSIVSFRQPISIDQRFGRFRKEVVPLFWGVLIMRILLSRALYQDAPYLREPPYGRPSGRQSQSVTLGSDLRVWGKLGMRCW